MQYDQARSNMVQKQVKTWQVFDKRILEAMSILPRERFVAMLWKPFAYTDCELPISHTQIMLSPKVIGRLLQAVQPLAFETVLEVGTGTGYLTALLAQLTKEVHSIEIFPDLLHNAKQSLQTLSHYNIHLINGDGSQGWPAKAPFHIIILTGALPYIPEVLYRQLQIGGRLVGFTGTPPTISAVLITRLSETEWEKTSIFETDLPFLIHSLPTPTFSF